MLNFAPTLRALTAGSPITRVMQEVRRMARRHLETGGAVVPAQGRLGSVGFRVPADVDVVRLRAAIEAKLRAGGYVKLGRNSGLSNLLERRTDGRFVVLQPILVQIGGGNADSGRLFLERLTTEIRRRRSDWRIA